MDEITPEIVRAFLREHQFELFSTHKKVCFPILERIFNKLVQGERFEGIKVADGLIMNGHHRYICYKILEIEPEIINWTKNSNDEITSWNLIEVDVIDWETPREIAKHQINQIGVIQH